MHCGRIDLAYKIEDLYCGSEEIVAPMVEVLSAEEVDKEYHAQQFSASNYNISSHLTTLLTEVPPASSPLTLAKSTISNIQLPS